MRIGRYTIRKLKRRGGTIILNSLYYLLVPLLNFLLYLMVLRISTPSVWGNLVELLLVVNLVMHFMSWGNMQYLLRAFSQKPATISRVWQSAFFSRLIFLALPGLFFFLFYPPVLAFGLFLWLIFLFFYRAFEVFVVYQKKFLIAIIAEVTGFLVLIVGIYSNRFFLRPEGFAQIFFMSMFIRAVILSIPFIPLMTKDLKVRVEWGYFKWAFPFFLTGLIGLLQEKTDLYLMALIATDEALGKYHVLISALIILKTGAGFILQPYVKNIYRLPERSLKKLRYRMSIAGAGIVLIGTFALKWIIPAFFKFDFEWEIYALGAAFAFPFYYYINLIYRLYRQKRETTMVMISVIGTAINAVLSIALIPVWGLKGALFATTIAEWLFILMYWAEKQWGSGSSR